MQNTWIPLALLVALALSGAIGPETSEPVDVEAPCDHHDKRCTALLFSLEGSQSQAGEAGIIPDHLFLDLGDMTDGMGIRTGFDAQASTTVMLGGHEASASIGASIRTGTPDEKGEAEPIAPCTDSRGCPDLGIDRLDLIQDLRIRNEFIPPGDCNIEEGNTEEGFRRMIRFTLTVPNDGPGNLVIGSPADRPELFVYATCHRHYHFIDFADYRLWTLEGYERWENAREGSPGAKSGDLLASDPALSDHLIAGHKQGFCLIDIKPYTIGVSSNFHDCDDQGITAGWGDSYVASLDGQFIDITGAAAGWYVLEIEVNPARLIEEDQYTDNRAVLQLYIPSEGGE